MIEASIEPILVRFARSHDLYLDKKCFRTARAGKKVTWEDKFGNGHDLDYVLEKGGSENSIGTPVAFIEIAWRRYTKHSRNKVQEIQGAILPLAVTYQEYAPFCGAILAGVFTEGALTQLHSQGFTVLYLEYNTVVESFRTVGIDADFDEDTPEDEFAEKVDKWERLDVSGHKRVAAKLVELNSEKIDEFVEKLDKAVKRQITLVLVIPLHGKPFEWPTIEKAIDFIKNYNEKENSTPVIRYEVEIRYNNGDVIKGIFTEKGRAIQFLRGYEPTIKPPSTPKTLDDW